MAKMIPLYVKNNAAGEPEIFLSDPDAPPPPPPRTQRRGVNLAGGAVSYTKWPAATGPIKDSQYKFVPPSEIDQYMAEGMTTFRVVFSWESLQPTEYAVLDTLSGNFKIYRDALLATVSYIVSKNGYVLLDMHGEIDADFAAYKGVKVGAKMPSGQKVEDLLSNVWGQLAKMFLANDRVMFGITNEPHDIPATTWFAAAQKTILAIRATGNTNKIIAPGTDWTGAASWMQHNASAWNLTDPANNLAVQVHLYCDDNEGGGTEQITRDTIGPERLKDVTAWCRSKGLELWIAEFGLNAANPIATATLRNTLAFIDANRDVIAGFIWWAAGPSAWSWNTYRFTLLNAGAKPSAQLLMLRAANAFPR